MTVARYNAQLKETRSRLRAGGVTVQFVGSSFVSDTPMDTRGRVTQGWLTRGQGPSLVASHNEKRLRITSLFQSYEQFRIDMLLNPHGGLDVDNPPETIHPEMYAWAPGEVIEIVENVEDNPGGGKAIRLDHTQYVTSKYSHMDDIDPGLRVGDWVARGERVGWMGNTGKYVTNKRADGTGGEHLHFSCRYRGALIDPMALMVSRMVYDEIQEPRAPQWVPGMTPTPYQMLRAAIDTMAGTHIPGSNIQILEEPTHTWTPDDKKIIERWTMDVSRPWLVPLDDEGTLLLPPEGGRYGKADYERDHA